MGGMLSIFRKAGTAKTPDARPGAANGLAVFLAPPVSPLPVADVSAVASALADVLRAKLVFAADATASREPAWNAAKELTDDLLAALPGQLDVALAVHGGSRLHTFTPFTANANELRDRAAGVKCKAGRTCLLDILARVLETEGVSVVVYIGDTFEESESRARKLADALKAHGTRLIVLHDAQSPAFGGADIFADMAERTGGAVLPFDASALPKLRELLAAVAVLAVGGVPALAAQRDARPGARLLLEHLGGEGKRR